MAGNLVEHTTSMLSSQRQIASSVLFQDGRRPSAERFIRFRLLAFVKFCYTGAPLTRHRRCFSMKLKRFLPVILVLMLAGTFAYGQSAPAAGATKAKSTSKSTKSSA